jgi:hypothetical protein
MAAGGQNVWEVARTLLSANSGAKATATQFQSDHEAKVRRERRNALIIPREHGAWGLLLVPMITAAGVAFRENHHVLRLVLLLIAALALFWLRTPLESLLGTSPMCAQTGEERRIVLLTILVVGKIAFAALATLLWAGHNPKLWLIGIAAASAFAAQALLKKLGRRTRMLSEMIGTVGLTAGAPAAYYLITGKLDSTAWMLWVANFIFAGNQIHYVQIRIHTARVEGLRDKLAKGWTFAAGQLLMAVVLAAACALKLMPWLALIAFAPLLLRGWLYFFEKPAPLRVRRLGWNELGQAIAFCILFITVFAFR